MKPPPSRLLLLLSALFHCTLWSDVRAATTPCDVTAPDNCTFEWGTSCNWIMGQEWTVYNYPPSQRSLGLSGHHGRLEQLESRTACNTNGDVHCLKFKYRFEQNDVLDLNVYVLLPQGRRRQKLWTLSGSYGWEEAHVPVRTSSDFILVIEALSSGARRVFVDSIHYEKRACTILPPSAAPPRPVVVYPKTYESAPTTTLSVGVESTNDVTGSPSVTPEPASSNVGLTIGVLLAAVLLLAVVVGVVLCIVCRKKRRFRAPKTCCMKKRKKKGKEEETVVGTLLRITSPQEGNETARFLSREDSNRQRSEDGHDTSSPTSSSPTEHYYCTIDSPVDRGKFTFSTADRGRVDSPGKTVNNNNSRKRYTVGNPYQVTVLAINPSPSPDDGCETPKFHLVDDDDQQERLLPHSSCAEQTYNYPTTNEAESHPSISEADTDSGFENMPKTDDPQNATYQNLSSMKKTQEQNPPKPLSSPKEYFEPIKKNPSAKVDPLSPSRKTSNVDPLSPNRKAYTVDPLSPSRKAYTVDPLPPKRKLALRDEPSRKTSEGVEPDVSESPGPADVFYHELEEQHSPAESCSGNPQNNDAKTRKYQKLDFEKPRGGDEKEKNDVDDGDDVPFLSYNRLNEGDGGKYDEIDRDRKVEVIDKDYYHI